MPPPLAGMRVCEAAIVASLNCPSARPSASVRSVRPSVRPAAPRAAAELQQRESYVDVSTRFFSFARSPPFSTKEFLSLP